MGIRPIILAVLAFGSALLVGAAASPAGEPFIVHEWGVVFLSGATGQIPFQPSECDIAQLPDFVMRHADMYPHGSSGMHRKPVIYLYGDEDKQVVVELSTAQGVPVAYWPRPQIFPSQPNGPQTGENSATRMVWNLSLHKEASQDLLAAPDGHWWGEARKVPAMYLRTTIGIWGSERFVFYEATAKPPNAITEELAGDHLTLTNHGSQPSGTILVIINDGDGPHLTVVPAIDAQGNVALDRKVLLSAGGDDKQLLAACKKQWVEFGMTDAEGDAIVAIWKKEILSMRGFLIVRRIPAADYEAIFPLKVTPKPDELVRVSMVFDTLPGRPERLDWLPGLKAAIDKWAGELGNDDFTVREKATRLLAGADDLAKPMLQKLAQSTDPEVRTRAQGLLARLNLPPADPPR